MRGQHRADPEHPDGEIQCALVLGAVDQNEEMATGVMRVSIKSRNAFKDEHSVLATDFGVRTNPAVILEAAKDRSRVFHFRDGAEVLAITYAGDDCTRFLQHSPF